MSRVVPSANIAQTLAEAANRWGDKTAIIEAKSGVSLSFARVYQRSLQFAALLQKQGVQAGDRSMLMVRPGRDFICLSFALFSLGAPVILIDPGMGYRNLLRCIARVQPRVLIGIPAVHYFSRLFPGPFRTLAYRCSYGRSWGLGGRNILAAVETADGLPQPCSSSAEDLAAIIFTTGSTGPPKGVAYQHSMFNAQLQLIREYYGIDEHHTDQPAFPLFALFSIALGATAVIPDMDPTRPARVNPARYVDSLQRYRVSYSFASPALWQVVSRYCQEQKLVLSHLQKVLIAGAPVPGSLLERLRMVLPETADVHTPYGATESLPIVSMESREILASTWEKSRRGGGFCVGRALPGIQVRVIAQQSGAIEDIAASTELPAGEIGEIIVRGSVVTRQYVNNAEETALAKIADGDAIWHRLGDVGYLDQQGRLWFCGRKAHQVRTAGGILCTIPCEAIVNEHPQVLRSALVGVPQADGWQQPVLIIETVKNFTGDRQQLLHEVAALAAASPLTASVTTFLEHPEFPVDIRHNAKIFREKLAVWAAQQLERR